MILLGTIEYGWKIASCIRFLFIFCSVYPPISILTLAACSINSFQALSCSHYNGNLLYVDYVSPLTLDEAHGLRPFYWGERRERDQRLKID